MNRIVIKFDDNGEIDVIACDQECRIFFYDEKCISEPLYELTTGLTKVVGVHEVRNIIGDTPAATIDSDGPWKRTNPVIYAYRDFSEVPETVWEEIGIGLKSLGQKIANFFIRRS